MEKLKRREDMKREERNGYVSLSLSLSFSLSFPHPLTLTFSPLLHAPQPPLLSRLPNANQKPIQKKKQQLEERLQREGVKTHKERVQELNKYLSTLSEHNDMPRIGPG